MGKEDDKFISRLFKKVGKTIHTYGLLHEGDRVLAAISGGKDSLVMLECLANRRRYLPFKFEIVAAHVHITNVGYESNLEFMRSFCLKLDIPLHIIEYTLENVDKSNKNPCFVCSWHRRKKIFDLSKTLNCNKIAFGHHMEDALETLLMNMMYHGSISSLPQKLEMFDGRVHAIRPLLNTYEEDIEKFASMRSYPKQIKSCPYENATKRLAMREIIENINQLYGNAKLNIFRSMDTIYHDYLPGKK